MLTLGKLYTIHDGKIENQDLTLNQELVEAYGSKYPNITIKVISQEEQSMVPQDQLETLEEDTIYQSFLQRKEAILKQGVFVSFDEKGQIMTTSPYLVCLLPKEMDKTDIELLSHCFANLIEEPYLQLEIKNFHFDPYYGENYDDLFFYSAQKQAGIESLNIFLHEKTNTLTKEEQYYLMDFRQFDLKNILKDTDQNPLCDSRAGVCVITKEQKIAENCTKQFHEKERDFILEHLTGMRQNSSLSDQEIADQRDCCIMRFSKGLALVATPEENRMTDFQREQTKNMLDEISELKKEMEIEVLFTNPSKEIPSYKSRH